MVVVDVFVGVVTVVAVNVVVVVLAVVAATVVVTALRLLIASWGYRRGVFKNLCPALEIVIWLLKGGPKTEISTILELTIDNENKTNEL